jgi:hypothetical protein
MKTPEICQNIDGLDFIQLIRGMVAESDFLLPLQSGNCLNNKYITICQSIKLYL